MHKQSHRESNGRLGAQRSLSRIGRGGRGRLHAAEAPREGEGHGGVEEALGTLWQVGAAVLLLLLLVLLLLRLLLRLLLLRRL